jgi:hypothetical protein
MFYLFQYIIAFFVVVFLFPNTDKTLKVILCLFPGVNTMVAIWLIAFRAIKTFAKD